MRDSELMLKDFENAGLDVTSQKCKKCELETLSEGIIRRYQVLVHGRNVYNFGV